MIGTIPRLSLGGSILALIFFALQKILGGRLRKTVVYYLWLIVLLRFLLPIPSPVSVTGWLGELTPMAAVNPMPVQEEYLTELEPTGKVGLCRCHWAMSPMLVSLRTPEILLPPLFFDEEALGHILRHELLHYRRGDLYYKWFLLLVSCLHWFNPLMPWIRREIGFACELSCDEGVIEGMSPRERRGYGEVLLTLSVRGGQQTISLATTMSEEKRQMKGRLQSIMTEKKRGAGTVALSLVLAMLLTACGTLLGTEGAGNAAGSTGSGSTRALKEEELRWFNESYFNGEYGSIRNQLLLSYYNVPEEIDLYETFYLGSRRTESVNGVELDYMEQEAAKIGELWNWVKISTETMVEVLQEYLGLSLEETDQVGLGKFTYQEAFNAYYLFKRNTNFRTVTVTAGTRDNEGNVLLNYTPDYGLQNVCRLWLRETEEGYRFVANQRLHYAITTESTDPESGLVASMGSWRAYDFPDMDHMTVHDVADYASEGLTARSMIRIESFETMDPTLYLDYADDELVVFHLDADLFVYDLAEQEIRYALSFEKLLGHGYIDIPPRPVGYFLQVSVSENGKIIQIKTVGDVGEAQKDGVPIGDAWYLFPDRGLLMRQVENSFEEWFIPKGEIYWTGTEAFTPFPNFVEVGEREQALTGNPNHSRVGVPFFDGVGYLATVGSLDNRNHPYAGENEFRYIDYLCYIRDDMVWLVFDGYFLH